MNNKKQHSIYLNHSEALVFFEWLASLEDKDKPKLDEAEQLVLWRIEGQLESTLVEIVQKDYKEKVQQAKKNILKDTD